MAAFNNTDKIEKILIYQEKKIKEEEEIFKKKGIKNNINIF